MRADSTLPADITPVIWLSGMETDIVLVRSTRTMTLNRSSRIVISAMFCLFILAPKASHAAGNEPVESRKVKVRVNPAYPDLARRMNITGSVNLLLTVAPDGSVKDCRPVGGHPLLVDAATTAARKWRYEPAAQSSTISVMFKFDRQQ